MPYSHINFLILYYPHKIFLGSNLILDIYIFSVGNGTYLTDGSFQSLIKGIRKMSVGQGCAVIIIWKKKKRVFDPQFLLCHLNIIFFRQIFLVLFWYGSVKNVFALFGGGKGQILRLIQWGFFSYPVRCCNREKILSCINWFSFWKEFCR